MPNLHFLAYGLRMIAYFLIFQCIFLHNPAGLILGCAGSNPAIFCKTYSNRFEYCIVQDSAKSGPPYFMDSAHWYSWEQSIHFGIPSTSQPPPQLVEGFGGKEGRIYRPGKRLADEPHAYKEHTSFMWVCGVHAGFFKYWSFFVSNALNIQLYPVL